MSDFKFPIEIPGKQRSIDLHFLQSLRLTTPFNLTEDIDDRISNRHRGRHISKRSTMET